MINKNYKGLKKVMRIIIITTFCLKHCWLVFCFPDIRKPFLLSEQWQQFGKIYLCNISRTEMPFSPGPDPFRIHLQNSETLCILIHGNVIICIRSLRIYFPCNRTQVKTLVIVPTLWLECNVWESHAQSRIQARQLEGTSVDFMEPIRSLGTLTCHFVYRVPSSLTG